MNTTDHKGFQIGMNVRYPPFYSRRILDEIAFARSAEFDCVQFAVREPGEYAFRLGASWETLGQALHNANLTSVMEIVVRIDQSGRNAIGQMPLVVLKSKLPVITIAANCWSAAFAALLFWKSAACRSRAAMERIPTQP